MNIAERFDQALIGTIYASLMLAGSALFCAGFVLIAAQCVAWLRFGEWQSIPVFALWLSPIEQLNQLVPMNLWAATWSPLALVPSLSDQASLADFSRSIGGSMEGVIKGISWILSAPLSVSLWAFGLLLISTAKLAEDARLPQSA